MDNIIITENGKKLLAEINAGKIKAEFSKIVTSDEVYEEHELRQLSSFKHICQQTEILHVDVKEDFTVVISGYVNNQGLETGYYVNLIGIYAKTNDTEEILYGVATVGNRPYLPGASETLTGISLRLTLKIESSENIFVRMDETTALTIGEFHAYEREFDKRISGLEFPVFDDYDLAEDKVPTTIEAIESILSEQPIYKLLQYIKASLIGLHSDSVTLNEKLQKYNPFVTMYQNIPVSERAEDKWYLLVADTKGVSIHYCSQYVLMDEDIPLEEREESVLYGSETEAKSDLEPFEKPATMRILNFESLESREIPEGSTREQDIFYFYETEEKRVWQE